MIRVDKNMNVLTDAEVDSLMLLLEASFASTGDSRIFEIIDILMKDTQQSIQKQNAVRFEQSTSS